jgi:hypothetical protein
MSTSQLVGSGTPAAVGAWSSSNESAATVDDNGLVSGVAEGTTMITYTDINGCSVTEEVSVTLEACSDYNPCAAIMFVNAMFLANDPHQALFHAGLQLLSDGIITTSNMEDISFKAGNHVELKPGFEVQQGAVLTIDIEDCILNNPGAPMDPKSQK